MHRRQLPVLDPCGEDFAAMAPDGARRRHCERCRTPVHDLSAMTRAEARLLLLRAQGRTLCLRYRTDAGGQLLFRAPPARTTGPLVTALTGLVAACTSTTPALDVPPVPEIAWVDESGPTIPGGEQDGVEAKPGVVEGGIVGGVMSATMGVVAVGIACTGYPAPDVVLVPPTIRPREPDTRDRRDGEHPLSRARTRRAERAERRRLRREARRAEREARRSEREHEKAIREAEREVEQETRRARRRRLRRARRAERRARRAERREARRLRRHARRAARHGTG